MPTTPRSEIPYLTPLDPDCQWQDPNGPWNNPGPSAGPYYAKMEDGSTSPIIGIVCGSTRNYSSQPAR